MPLIILFLCGLVFLAGFCLGGSSHPIGMICGTVLISVSLSCATYLVAQLWTGDDDSEPSKP